MKRPLTQSQKRKARETSKAVRNIALGGIVLAGIAGAYLYTVFSHKPLDDITLCPAQPSSLTVLLVDVTDPMNVPQRQDFVNQLERLIDQIPRHGKLVIAKVDPVSDHLLSPVITRCNPGSARDESSINGNPAVLERLRQEEYLAAIRAVADDLLTASAADRSPILESIQSINLTELQAQNAEGIPRRLIIASDLLQNTDSLSFYGGLPDGDQVISSQAFSRVRTDLRGVDVEIWMLQRNDSAQTQPRALPNLWERLIDEVGGTVQRVYTVSG